MLYSELYGKLILLTQLNNITHAEIADCIGIKHGAVFSRAKRNSKINPQEITLIERKYDVNISSIYISDNSLERQFDEKLYKKQNKIGDRINQIQEKNKLSNEQMAMLLNISNEEYCNIKNLKAIPNIQTLNNIKQNFKISVDWLLYGD